MNSLTKKLLVPRHEYLILDGNLSILETSYEVKRFAEHPDELSSGKDIRLFFPEIIGLEETLLDILEGRQLSFELKGIARSNGQKLVNPAQSTPNLPLYFDLYINGYCEQETFENQLVVLLQDATERMTLQQTLVHQANEATLLLNALVVSQNYIDRIITSMADALLVTTETGIIITVNQATQALFGYNQEELIGKSIFNLIAEEKALQEITIFSSSASIESSNNLEVICQKKSGETIAIAFSCSVIPTETKGLRNFVYVGRDITERKRAEAEIIEALEREKELRELKSRFISMTSHEFRTPLTSILSSTELLEIFCHKWTEDKKIKHFNRIKSSVQQMTQLLEDILLLSKAESGKLEFNPKPLKVESFCKDLVEIIQFGIGANHNIDFIYSGQKFNTCLDERLLQHILNNLLTNAVKYSPQSTTVHFSCQCLEREVIFEIQDEGIGIPLEDQKQLFESFHRATNVGNIPGTGLGLAIVQYAIELHGGKIAFTSEAGVGTTFQVTLPLNPDSGDVWLDSSPE